MTDFEKLLVRGFVTFYMNNATRAEVRAFNKALTKFKYLSFYPYGENGVEANLMFIAFSNEYRIAELNNNHLISTIVSSKDEYQHFLASRLSTVMDRHHMISIKDIKELIEPLSIERLNITENLFNQPVIREVQKDILHDSIIQFLYKDEHSDNYAIVKNVQNFFNTDTRITVNLVYDFNETITEYGFDRTYLHMNYTVAFDSVIIGFISESGTDFNNLKRKIYTTDRKAWIKMMRYVEDAIEFDDHYIGVEVFDIGDDCDTVMGLPGKTGSLAVYTKEPWKK